jgi:hypothetical protein
MSRSRRRIAKLEERISVAQEKQDAKLRLWAEQAPFHAIRHATAAAAIVLAGRPKVGEPLRQAWSRALQNYGIGIHIGQEATFAQLFNTIIMGGDMQAMNYIQTAKVRFPEIFKTAPIWFLQFTAMAIDCRALKFQLPDLKETLTWGSAGYEDARRWPLLPLGTMTAGEPIPKWDARRLWIIMNCQITVPMPDVEELISQRQEERARMKRDRSDTDKTLIDGLAFLDLMSEKELSRYQKRRIRKLHERLSK